MPLLETKEMPKKTSCTLNSSVLKSKIPGVSKKPKLKLKASPVMIFSMFSNV